jgi:hypothetical protein
MKRSVPSLKLILEANIINKEKLVQAIAALLAERDIAEGSPIYNWFMTQYVKWYMSPANANPASVMPYTPTENDPDWMQGKEVHQFTQFDRETRDYILHVVDYFDTLEERELSKLHKVPYVLIVQKITEMDEEGSVVTNTFRRKLKEGTDYKQLIKIGNVVFVEATSQEMMESDGTMFANCVRKMSPSPDKRIIFGWTDPSPMKAKPIVCIRFNGPDNKHISEIKGWGNIHPIKEIYKPSIRKFVEFLTAKKGYKVTADGENIGMIRVSLGNDTSYYYEDSEEFQEIYRTKIKPMQDAAIEKIKSNIITMEADSIEDLISKLSAQL